jgi:DNA invertase Pin-like site-specific DNA recombinase
MATKQTNKGYENMTKKKGQGKRTREEVKRDTDEKRNRAVEMRTEGYSTGMIAKALGVTRARVSQLIKEDASQFEQTRKLPCIKKGENKC